uniref:HAT C-terminal dimerisation domain-containing protein n=1 Tax=Hippocampus comes TaxID=109280 RepID=A0A3Q2YRB0_HIPCM
FMSSLCYGDSGETNLVKVIPQDERYSLRKTWRCFSKSASRKSLKSSGVNCGHSCTRFEFKVEFYTMFLEGNCCDTPQKNRSGTSSTRTRPGRCSHGEEQSSFGFAEVPISCLCHAAHCMHFLFFFSSFFDDNEGFVIRRWFVETLSPLGLCEHPYTRELFAYLSPEFQLMSRKILARGLDELMHKAKLEVNNLLSKQKWVATTADCWTVAFLGMTVHWIDRPSLVRRKATLACRELKTDQLLAEVIRDVHQEFGIVKKVVATTTDNGTNYVAVLNAFGEPQEEDEEVLPGQPGDVQGHLDGEDVDAEPRVALPPHRRCSAHTLNLMATTDIRAVTGWSVGDTPWCEATAKAQHLWNLQNRIPIAANQIKEAVNRKEKVEKCVYFCRWNCYFNSVKVLLEVMSLPEQVEVLTEYRDVMKPVVDTLDNLRGEDSAYMGVLLPTLLVLKRWLLQHQQRGELQYAEPLVQSLLRGFEKRCVWVFMDENIVFANSPSLMYRFGSLFEDQDLLMASALHPSFTPAFLARIVPEQADAIKDRILGELKALVSDHREAWVDLFIKYNTPLPSSAAVERTFSTAGDVLRPKRAALASPDFQNLVFLKGNMSLLGYPSYKGQFAEEEQEQY